MSDTSPALVMRTNSSDRTLKGEPEITTDRHPEAPGTVVVQPRSPAHTNGKRWGQDSPGATPHHPTRSVWVALQMDWARRASRPDAHQHVAIWTQAAPQLDALRLPRRDPRCGRTPGAPRTVLPPAQRTSARRTPRRTRRLRRPRCAHSRAASRRRPALADRPGRRSMDKPRRTRHRHHQRRLAGHRGPRRRAPRSSRPPDRPAGRAATPQLLRGVPARPESRVPHGRRRAARSLIPARRIARPHCSTMPSVSAASVVLMVHLLTS